MTYRPTVLNVSMGLSLLMLFINTIQDYKALAAEEGWGILATIGLSGICLVALIVDLTLQKLIKNRITLNIVECIIVIGLAMAILPDL